MQFESSLSTRTNAPNNVLRSLTLPSALRTSVWRPARPMTASVLSHRDGKRGVHFALIVRAGCWVGTAVRLFTLLTVISSAVHALDDPSLQGKKVVPSVRGFTLRHSPRDPSHASPIVVNVYEVREVRGRWVLLVDDWATVSGWAPADEVIPINNAVVFFTRKIEIEPGSTLWYFMRALVYRNTGRLDKAMQDLDFATRLCPSDPALHLQKSAVFAAKREYDDAIREADVAIRLDPTRSPSHYRRGLISSDQRQYDQAISSFGEAIRLDPSNSLAYLARGDARRKKADFAKAIADFTTAITVNPRCTRAYWMRGMCWVDLDEYDKAIVAFSECLRSDRQFAPAYVYRGFSWLKKNDFDRSIADYSEAVRLSPKPSGALCWRGIARRKKGDLDNAIKDSTAALETDPNYVEAYVVRGEIWSDKQNYDRAAADFKRAIELDKLNTTALTQYAWFLATCPVEKYRNGKLAVALAKQASELDGWNDSASLGTLACSFAEVGDFRSAIAWQTKALDLRDSSPDWRNTLQTSLDAFKRGSPYRDQTPISDHELGNAHATP